MWNLIKEVACIICNGRPSRVELPTDFPIYEMPRSQMIEELAELGLECQLKSKFAFPDIMVSYTDEKSWAKLIPFLTYPADEYVEEDCDCDNYAKKASADAAFLFKLEGCLQCWGKMPLGPHAWGLVICGHRRYKLFEPNSGFPYAGELFAEGENSYLSKSWK